jgi:hypothetical protein
MSVSAIGQHVLRAPNLSSKRSLGENEHARRRPLSRRLRLLLKLAIGLLIIVLLLGVVWVEPVVSHCLVT